MSSITVVAHHVDGSIQEFPCTEAKLQQLIELESSGHTGKSLITDLIGDDFGPPIRYVQISGTKLTGQSVNIRLHYT